MLSPRQGGTLPLCDNPNAGAGGFGPPSSRLTVECFTAKLHANGGQGESRAHGVHCTTALQAASAPYGLPSRLREMLESNQPDKIWSRVCRLGQSLKPRNEPCRII